MNLLQTILLLILNELLIIGIWYAFSPGEIFGKLGDYMEERVGEFWMKPIAYCIMCMSSVYGTLVFWLTHEPNQTNLIVWPLYICALCGLGRITTAALPNIAE